MTTLRHRDWEITGDETGVQVSHLPCWEQVAAWDGAPWPTPLDIDTAVMAHRCTVLGTAAGTAD